MGEVYSGRYLRENDQMRLLGDITVDSPESVCLPDEPGWTIAGNALRAYPVLEWRAAEKELVRLPSAMPDAAAVVTLAAPLLAAGCGMDAAQAAPLYVRDKVALTVAERLATGGRA